MTDTIASRVTRVIGGSVHALLDAVENAAPEATMAQAIREVDQAIDEVRGELGRVEAVEARRLVEPQQAQHPEGNAGRANRHRDGQGRRDACPRRHRQADRHRRSDPRAAALAAGCHRSRQGARRLYRGAHRQEARNGVGAAGLHRGARGRGRIPPAKNASSGTTQGKVDRAGSAFDRVMARETGLAGGAPAINADAAKLQELQEMARTHRIDERLAALKAANRRSTVRTSERLFCARAVAVSLWPPVVMIAVAVIEALALLIGASCRIGMRRRRAPRRRRGWRARLAAFRQGTDPRHPGHLPDGVRARRLRLAQFAVRAATGHSCPALLAVRDCRRRGSACVSASAARAEPDHPTRRDHGGARCEPRRPGRTASSSGCARRQAGARRACMTSTARALPHGRAGRARSGPRVRRQRPSGATPERRHFHAIHNPKPGLL